MMPWLIVAMFASFLISAVSKAAEPARPNVQTEINWPSFLARQDMTWDQLPRQWNEGAFLGNGQIGLMVYTTPSDNCVEFHLGRVDVTDHRKAPDRKTSRGTPGADVMFDFPRLDIGRMRLFPAGKIVAGTMRVHLWNAELTATIKTDLGELQIRAVTLYDQMVHVIDVRSTERTPDGQPSAWRWEMKPGNPASPRAQVFPDKAKAIQYVTNPNPKRFDIDGVSVCVQPLLAGGDYATAWLDQRADASQGRLLVSTANEVPASDKSASVAVADVRRAGLSPTDKLVASHRDWWHAYYPRTFVAIPDARFEQFYWIQLFKLASASRPDAPPLDNLGPFYRVNQWPGLWWNLNVQITYWPVYTGNRLELMDNLIREIDENFDGLARDFCKSPKIGDFAWVLQNYWLYYRYTGDWNAIAERWLPKARVVLAGYQKKLKANAKGKLELLQTESPEFDGFKSYTNSNYNLALLRWLLNAMVEIDARSPGGPSAEATEWKNIQRDLIPFPTDENGLRVSSDQAFNKSHRHFSHLLALYPLFVLNPDATADRDLVSRSVEHWHRIGQGKALAGYSYTGGAALYAALGKGDEAAGMLRTFLTGDIGISQLLPNTLYVESGGKNPVLETPHSAASAMTDLTLQSWGGKIRVFQAVPGEWQSANFHLLRAMGGFVVSAAREQGKTAWVVITSEAGEPCVVKLPDWRGPIQSVGAETSPEEIAPGEYRIRLAKGESCLLRPAGSKAEPIIRWSPLPNDQPNLFGLKRGQELKTSQSWPEVPLPAN